MLAPGPGSAGVAAPAPGGDRPRVSGRPSRPSRRPGCPSCLLGSRGRGLPILTNQLSKYLTNELANSLCLAKKRLIDQFRFLNMTNMTQLISHGHWHLLNRIKNINTLLIIGGVELNPAPDPPKRLLRIAHVNINSITAENRMDELHQFVRDNNIHILALTETKLDDNIHPSLYRLDNFHNPITHHRNRHGGGTAIYAHKSLPITQMQPPELNPCEDWVWCKITIAKISLLISCIYLPPNLDANRLEQFTENLLESINLTNTYSATVKIILGDFNAGNNYLNHASRSQGNSGITSFDLKLSDTAETLDLVQVIKEPTRITDGCANLRDLIFVSNSELLNDSGTLSSFSRLDHFPVFAELSIEPPEHQTFTKTIWDYEKIDSDLFIAKLQQTDWDSIVSKDIHTAVKDFTQAILNVAKLSIPRKQVRIKNHDKPWVNNELKRNIRKRNMLFSCAKRTQSDVDWRNWKYQRNIVTSLNRRLHSEHIQSEVNRLINNKQDPHKYPQILSNLTGRRQAIRPAHHSSLEARW